MGYAVSLRLSHEAGPLPGNPFSRLEVRRHGFNPVEVVANMAMGFFVVYPLPTDSSQPR
jgi:hypothetical protein